MRLYIVIVSEKAIASTPKGPLIAENITGYMFLVNTISHQFYFTTGNSLRSMIPLLTEQLHPVTECMSFVYNQLWYNA